MTTQNGMGRSNRQDHTRRALAIAISVCYGETHHQVLNPTPTTWVSNPSARSEANMRLAYCHRSIARAALQDLVA
jgi:hypothetical protein